MKNIVFYISILLSLNSNLYGEETGLRVLLQQESMEHGSVSSVGIYSEGIFYGGISVNYIKSSTVVQYSNRETIYPVYLIVGFRAPWKIAPYIEAGADLPEVLFDALFNSEDNPENEIDFYYSGGLEISVTDRFSLSFYAKRYNFIFREDSSASKSKSKQTSYGAGAIIRF